MKYQTGKQLWLQSAFAAPDGPMLSPLGMIAFDRGVTDIFNLPKKEISAFLREWAGALRGEDNPMGFIAGSQLWLQSAFASGDGLILSPLGMICVFCGFNMSAPICYDNAAAFLHEWADAIEGKGVTDHD